MKGLKATRESNLLPSIQWTSIIAIIRTMWTKSKQAKRTTIGPVDVGCSNCGQDVETTTHLMYTCQLADLVWTTMFTTVNDELAQRISDFVPQVKECDAILFHYLPNIKDDRLRLNVIELIMIIKHILYRLKFRENYQRFPTQKRVLLLTVIELEKLITCRKFLGKDYGFLFDIKNAFREKLGMGSVEDV